MTELSIKDKTVLGIRDEVAAQLIKNWERIAPLADGDAKKPPSKENAQRMASELIERGHFDYFNERDPKQPHNVNLKAMREKFTPLAQYSPEVKGLLNNFQIIDQIPTKDQAEQIGEAVERGVKKGSSGFTSIWNYIAGFIQWAVQAIQHLFDKSKPYKGLSECIGECFAKTTSSAVSQELTELGRTDPRLGKILTHERKEQIASTVHAGAIAQAKGEALKTANPLDNAVPESAAVLDHVAVKKAVTETISSMVDTKFDSKMKGKSYTVTEGLQSTRLFGGYGFDADQVKEVKDAVKDTFGKAIYTRGDKAIHKLDNPAMKQAILDKLSEKLALSKDEKIKSQAKDFVKAMGEAIDNDTLKMVKDTNVAMDEAQRIIGNQAKQQLLDSPLAKQVGAIGDGLKQIGGNFMNVASSLVSAQTTTVAKPQDSKQQPTIN